MTSTCYEIATIEGRLVREIYIVTIDNQPVVYSSGGPLWFLRREDAQRWIDDRMHAITPADVL